MAPCGSLTGLVSDALAPLSGCRSASSRVSSGGLRQVRRCTWRRRCSGGAGGSARIFGFLRRHHHGLGGVECLLALFATGHVYFSRNSSTELVGAQQRVQGVVDLEGQVMFDGLPVFERNLADLSTIGQPIASRPAEQVSVHVHHRNQFGRQTFHGARHQVGDGNHVLSRQPRARTKTHQYAGFCGLARIGEDRFLG